MNIGFEAKRVFQNTTGLGNYARTLVSSLATYFPENEYFLFAPKISNQFNPSAYSNIHTVLPQGFLNKRISSLWRSNWVTKDLPMHNIQLYHGLSHEIPVGIEKTGIKSVVTIHDLIFERYPNQFKAVDRLIYRKKFRHACEKADKIIAISQQTKTDIIDFYKIDANKIDVCYQSCSPAFGREHDKIDEQTRLKLQLPEQYFISVGSIIERKNLLNVVAAYQLEPSLLPIVVIGSGDDYENKVRHAIASHSLQRKFIFLNDIAKAVDIKIDDKLLGQLFKESIALVYVSIFEGFGIPIIEAQAAGTPVITSNISCMPEAGGPNQTAKYVNPLVVDEIANAMMELQNNDTLRQEHILLGKKNIEKFSLQNCATEVMATYKSLS